MHAAILSIGDELTLGQTVGTNSAWLAEQLAGLAIVTMEHRTVADDRAAIATAIAALARQVDVLVITGGLGPTQDDLTRHALADVLAPGKPLVTEPAAVAHVTARFARRGAAMPPSNLVQAQRPETARFIPNPGGTALGLAARFDSCRIFCLPGPPREMQPMFADHVAPQLAPSPGGAVLRSACVHEYGLGESDAEERLGELTRRDRHPLVGITVSEGVVSARIRATGPQDRAGAEVEGVARQVLEQWRPYAFGRDDQTLARVVGDLLNAARLKLVTAESCTGGLLGSMIVSVAGSSEYYLGGWITYSNALKQSTINVPGDLLDRRGAVSEPVAAAMAEGALARASADVALSITGIAGPDGGSPQRPVGAVFVGLARRTGGATRVTVRRFAFTGDRQQIRDRAAKSALQLLRFALIDAPSDMPLIWQSTAHAPQPSSTE